MKSQKQVLVATLLYSAMIVLTVLLSPVRADEKQWVVLQDNIPQEIERFNIVLKFTQSDSSFYDVSQHQIKSQAIKNVSKKEDYSQQLDFGTAVDGYQYVALIKNASEMNVIGQNSDRLCMVKVLRIKDNKKPEIAKEGILSLNSDIEIPIEVSPDQVIVPYKEMIKGQLEINMSNHDNPVYEGRSRTTLNGNLSGSTSAKKAFLNASVTCRSSLELKDRYLSLSLKPFDEQTVSVSCNGKISDTLMLGSAKLVVEKIASDSSELVLALLDGNLDPVKKQDYALAAVGKPFPSFARVELVKRQLLTLDDLRKDAGADGYVVLIFGDFKRDPSPFFGGRPPMRNLSLDERMISDMLKKDCEKPIIIAFVCQQLSISDLYEKWLGHDPEFRVLSDFSNPLNVFGAAGMDPRMFNLSQRGERVETLRGNLKFENEKTITVLVDGNGDTVYLNTDAGNELADSLVKINTLMREGKKAEKQN